MSVLQLQRIDVGSVGVEPGSVKMITTDSLATVTTAGYLNGIGSQITPSVQLSPSDVIECLYSFNASTGAGTLGFFQPSIASGVITLVEWVNPSNVLLPVVSGDIPQFNGTSGQIEDSNILASSLIVNSNNSGQSIAASTSSATPGTIRAIKGLMTETATTMTSGNLVGVRGEVDYKSASGGFLYGVQGKIISTGTLSDSSWNAGVFGQLDISAATINAGQVAPIWGDYGASSGTLTDQTGLYGIAMTNTTAAVLQGQIYLYGGAQNLLLLSTNSGLSGVTYFKAAGTSSGSWGNASFPTVSKVLTISVDGTTYYLPLVAQNS